MTYRNKRKSRICGSKIIIPKTNNLLIKINRPIVDPKANEPELPSIILAGYLLKRKKAINPPKTEIGTIKFSSYPSIIHLIMMLPSSMIERPD